MEKSELEEIKSRIDIVSLISGYTTLNKSGKNYKGLCPFHSEKTPSFMVSSELQIYKCFGCNEGGDAFTFVEKIEGYDFSTAVKFLADRAGVVLKETSTKNKKEKDRKTLLYEINHLALEFYHYLLTKHGIGKVALDYIKNTRQLSEQTIKDFGIGYAPNSWRSLSDYLVKKGYKAEDLISSGLAIAREADPPYYDRFRGRITFPIKDLHGNVIGFSARALGDETPKYLNTPETEVFHKRDLLFGLDKAKVAIKREKMAILVEGQMDVISAHQARYTNVIASGGTAVTEEQLKLLKKLTSNIVLCFDTDFAGTEAVKRISALAESQEIDLKVLVIPKPYKDLDELLKEKPELFEDALNNLVTLYDFYFLTSFSRNRIDDPQGKKAILDELVPLILGINNQVLKEHYIKKLSNDLAVSVDSVYSVIKTYAYKNRPIDRLPKSILETDLKEVSLQEYMLGLILKAPLDLAQTNLYKLGQRDFTDPILEDIFVQLKSYILERKRKFEIKFFSAKLEGALAPRVMSLYLKDLGSLEDDPELLKKELTETLRRIKKETVKREMKNLSNKIKEAEALGDFDSVARLSQEFKNISERLV